MFKVETTLYDVMRLPRRSPAADADLSVQALHFILYSLRRINHQQQIAATAIDARQKYCCKPANVSNKSREFQSGESDGHTHSRNAAYVERKHTLSSFEGGWLQVTRRCLELFRDIRNTHIDPQAVPGRSRHCGYCSAQHRHRGAAHEPSFNGCIKRVV